MAWSVLLLLVSAIGLLGSSLAQEKGSGGSIISVFFAESEITIAEGEEAVICVMAEGFTNPFQEVEVMMNSTYISASRQDLVAPRFPRLLRFTMNMSMDCIVVQAARDDVTEAEEIAMFRLIESGLTSIMLNDPVLTLIIEADPPMISVPGSVDASAGNAAVVCFTAVFPTNGEATIALSPMNGNAGNEDYDSQSIPSMLQFSSMQSLRQCVRIRTFNRTNVERVTFFIAVSPVNTSASSLPVLSRNQVTVTLHRRCFHGDIRLVNGSDDSQGRLELCFSGRFVTPCDSTSWTVDDATAVCRFLGFSGPASALTSPATFGTGSGLFFPSSIVCSSRSTSFLSCVNTERVSICQPNLGVSCGCSDNSIRLIGPSPTEGRLEVCRNNQWGTVCSQGWDDSDAAVICRQLNIQSVFPPSILRISDRVITGGAGPILLNNVQCTGSESNISQCSYSMNVTQCSHEMDAGVRCDARPIYRGCPRDQFQCDAEQICLSFSRVCDGVPDCITATSLSNITALDEQNCTQCTGNEIRPLIGGASSQEGLVEVCVRGMFRRVLLSSVTIREASVICRQLKLGTAGFPFSSIGLLQTDSSNLIQQATIGVIIRCSGNEQSLADCTVITRQGFFEFAAVKCIESTNCEDGMTRLVPESPSKNREMPREGRLEICYRGVWGAVHDSDWTGLDAAVTCLDLGFNGFAAVPLRPAYYPSDPSFLPVVYDFPQCTQLVTGSILNCSRQHFEFVGSPPRSLPSLEVETTASTTAASSSSRPRRQVWLPPPQGGSGLGSLLTINGGYPYPSLVGVRCEDSVPVGPVRRIEQQEEFPFRCFYESNCEIGAFGTNLAEDCCNSAGPDGRRGASYTSTQNQCIQCPPTTPTPSSDIICLKEGEIRLIIREQSAQEGLLQVCKNGTWNFMCSTSVSQQVAQVACRQLGFREFSSVVPQVGSSILPVSGDTHSSISLDSLSCSGSELDIVSCSGFRLNSTFCSARVASITCPNRPNILFSPPVFGNLTIELGRSVNLECHTDPQDYPRPTNITVNRNGISSTTTRFSESTVISRATLNDSTSYSCSVANAVDTTTRSFEIIVQGGTNADVTSIGFLRMSSINLQRQPPPGQQRTNTDMLEELVFGALPPAIPGQQVVTCFNTSRSSMDVQRRLDRFECVIVTSGGSTQTDAGAVVAQTAANFIQVALPGIFTDFETSSVGFCDANETVFNNRSIEWPETIAGETASISCPGATGNATRMCGSDTIWSAPNVSLCELAINIVSSALQQSITTDNYDELTNQVTVAIETASNDSSQQSVILVEGVSEYFGSISALVGTESGLSAPAISLPVMMSLSRSVARLQQWPANLFVANPYSSRILLSLESIAAQYAQIIPVNETIVVQEENFVLVAENAPVLVLRETGRVVSFENTALPSSVGSRRLADNQVASIALPPSMFERVTDRSQVGIFFALYNENTLFPVREETSAASSSGSSSVVGSPVVAATVGPRLSFNNLQTPVQISLRLMVPPDSVIREGSQSCVSWDFEGAGGSGNWSTAGCTTSITCDGIVRCNCTHLTNFAVLVDICSRVDPEGCRNNGVFEEALSVLTIIGASLSIIGLLLTIITLLAFKKLRGRDTTIYHVQLSVAVFFMLLVFVAGINKVSRVGGCVLVSFLIHYFTLAAIFWMSAEAALMFQKLVLVFRKVTRRIIVVTSLICWLTPPLFVLPPVIADLANGRESSNDLVIDRRHFCFLSNATVFWVTFLVPILLLVICNSVIFCIVIVILIKHTRGTLARTKESMQAKTVLRILISTAGILFLFGISWIFAALTITVPAVRLPAQVLFVIFNSLQGFFIFLFFCVLSKESRESWKELLSCGRYKSSFLNPSLKRGKHSNVEHLSTGKQKTSTSHYLTKTTHSSSISNGKNAYSTFYSGRDEKTDLSEAQEDPQYSYSVPKPSSNSQEKKDLSATDPNPNVYSSLVPATQDGGDSTQVYASPKASSAAVTGTQPDGVYINTIEMKNGNGNVHNGTSNTENETTFSS